MKIIEFLGHVERCALTNVLRCVIVNEACLVLLGQKHHRTLQEPSSAVIPHSCKLLKFGYSEFHNDNNSVSDWFVSPIQLTYPCFTSYNVCKFDRQQSGLSTLWLPSGKT